MIPAPPSTATTPRTLRAAWIRIALVTGVACAPALSEDASFAGKRLLTGTSSREALAATLLPRSEWRPFPPAKDRKAWESVSCGELGRARRDFVTARAEALLGAPWPALPATLYMDYARNGNRSRYEERYFERRRMLATLVLAECLEDEGRFLDEIANGIWAICEESAWCIPAHATRRPGDPLHRPDVQGLDLFACETAMTLAQTRFLLEDELAKLSPAIPERIRREVESRIVGPFAAGDGFGSSGWTDGFNNWSPWCASNVLGHFILFLDGQPGIIDIGRETYTATTFSRRRYELWFTRGLGHNAPVVNGVEQAPGRERMATDVRFAGSAESAALSMSLERAYPAEARVKSLRRSIELRRGDRPVLEVRDSLELEAAPSTVLVRLHAALEANLERPGRIAIACRPRALVLEYETEKLAAQIEPLPIEDPSLRAEWGETLWRIDLRASGVTERIEYSLGFRAEE